MSKQAYVLTAGHVIRGPEADAKASGASKVAFKVGVPLDLSSTAKIHMQGSFEWVDATVIDDLHDLALLQLAKNPFTGEMTSRIKVSGKVLPLKVGTVRLDAALPPEGDDVLISGYPLDIPTFVTQKGMVASESFSIKQTQLQGAHTGFLTTEAEDSILLDAVVNPGNSGGPVYSSSTGDVVGVCEAYENSPLFTSTGKKVQVAPEEFRDQNAGLAVVIPIEYGVKFLMKNGVSDFLSTRTR